MQSKATTVAGYLAELPEDRRKAIEAVRKTIKKNLDKGFKEGMQYGMIGYYVPHSIYPPGYHCDPKQPLPFASLASQKNHMAIYLGCVYSDEKHRERFIKEWEKEAAKGNAKKLDMGKSCIRFKKIEDVPLDVLGNAIKRVTLKGYIANYESVLAGDGRQSATSEKTTKKATKKATSKKPVTKKTAKKAARKTPAKKAPAKKKVTSKTTAKKRTP